MFWKHSYQNQNVTISFILEEKQILGKVKDSGEGIPEEFHETIFEKFGHVDIKKKGYTFDTGLGLTFCKMEGDGFSLMYRWCHTWIYLRL